uniref:Transposase (Putative), gypsy type n=1 Tax=Tanacetum cinerariifolium TaxID=118510 RepID=A0A6L2KRY3_TANCI|nr:hypothetical protein [Tanacetum cinerariifolium]
MDTIQLETAVSTISHEYLLEFTSEYGISEDLHPELPGPEEKIVDFPEGKKKHPSMLYQTFGFPEKLEQSIVLGGREGISYRGGLTHMDLFNLIRAPNPTKVKIGTRPRAAHEVPLLTITASRVIEMEDPVVATDSSGIPSTIERSPLDFANENPSQQSTGVTERKTKTGLVEEIAAMGPRVIKERRKRGNDGVDANAPPKVETPTNVSDPDPLSFANPQSIPKQNVVQSSKGAVVAGDPESENTSFTSMVGSPESIYQPEWGVTNGCRLDTPEACQDLVDHIAPPGYFSEMRHLHNDDFLSQYTINLARQVAMGSQLRLRFEQEAKLLKKSVAQVARRDQRIQARENEIKNLEALLEAETDMKKAAEAKNAELVKELENLRALFTDLQVSNDRLSQQVSTLQAQVTGEEKLKATFEEFKKYEDDRVEKRCAEMDARLDALSIDFDEELYPHMLTAITGRRWVIGHGLRLAVMKCEHGKANLDLEAIKAYNPKADTKYVAAVHALRDLKYLMVDQLESLKDSPIDIPMYLEGRDLKNPWSFKEEILLEDAIAANVSRAEKKKKCRVVCRTHGFGFAHHARSDGVLVSVPTVAPQGLAILLADAATQTETSEDGASPRLLRSKSLPAMYNLDWP